MKARKFIKRDRKTAGRWTGVILCHLKLPAMDQEFYFRASNTFDPEQALKTIRKFVDRQLPELDELIDGASLVIDAEIRASSGGLRRQCLGAWKFGEDYDSVFDEATTACAFLEPENDDWMPVDVEIKLSSDN